MKEEEIWGEERSELRKVRRATQYTKIVRN